MSGRAQGAATHSPPTGRDWAVAAAGSTACQTNYRAPFKTLQQPAAARTLRWSPCSCSTLPSSSSSITVPLQQYSAGGGVATRGRAVERGQWRHVPRNDGCGSGTQPAKGSKCMPCSAEAEEHAPYRLCAGRKPTPCTRFSRDSCLVLAAPTGTCALPPLWGSDPQQHQQQSNPHPS